MKPILLYYNPDLHIVGKECFFCDLSPLKGEVLANGRSGEYVYNTLMMVIRNINNSFKYGYNSIYKFSYEIRALEVTICLHNYYDYIENNTECGYIVFELNLDNPDISIALLSPAIFSRILEVNLNKRLKPFNIDRALSLGIRDEYYSINGRSSFIDKGSIYIPINT